jgi:hypothetical protein
MNSVILLVRVLQGPTPARRLTLPAFVLGGIGLLLGLGLALAAKKLAVPKDPRVEKIGEILPGSQLRRMRIPRMRSLRRGWWRRCGSPGGAWRLAPV